MRGIRSHAPRCHNIVMGSGKCISALPLLVGLIPLPLWRCDPARRPPAAHQSAEESAREPGDLGCERVQVHLVGDYRGRYKPGKAQPGNFGDPRCLHSNQRSVRRRIVPVCAEIPFE